MNENTAVRLSPLSDYPIDRSDLFALYKLSLFKFIDQTFGWVENFQQSRFDKSYPDEAFSVILLGAQAVGYVSQKSELDSLHLSLLLLQPAHRRRGVGRKVMQSITETASLTGKFVTLSCFLCNKPALTFYRKQGFVIVSTDECFATLQGPSPYAPSPRQLVERSTATDNKDPYNRPVK